MLIILNHEILSQICQYLVHSSINGTENEVFVCFSTCSDGTKNTGSNGIDMVTTNPGATGSEKVH